MLISMRALLSPPAGSACHYVAVLNAARHGHMLAMCQHAYAAALCSISLPPLRVHTRVCVCVHPPVYMCDITAESSDTRYSLAVICVMGVTVIYYIYDTRLYGLLILS